MKKIIIIAFVLLLVVLAGSVTYLFFWPIRPDSETVDFKIRWGAPISAVAAGLQQQGIVRSDKQFVFVVRLLRKLKRIRAGMFKLPKNSSNYKTLDRLINGPQTFVRITIPEGVDSRWIASVVAKKLDLDSLRFINWVNDPSFMNQLGIDASSLEGYLYPETYYVTYGLTEKEILKEFVNQFKNAVPPELFNAGEQNGFTMNEIMTLASIIEGEAVLAHEMPVISSVYHNRLKKSMRLQADPTIQYIIPGKPRRLLNRDLAIDSPYNTYRYAGLPPGPINNPGLDAIRAAVNPKQTGYLYFVATGDGGHRFSETWKGHLRAKAQFDAVRKQVARQKQENKTSDR
ncbi:endolytic transglycosylase MltG [candidate division KSB1 bacterium]|nr:endolytic transglycosylase MltG [candidate division KSB1 bacterium]